MDKATERINRLVGRRVKAGEREIARRYAQTLSELREFIGRVYQAYETGGGLKFEEMAKFDRMQTLFREVDATLARNYADLHGILTGILSEVYQDSHDTFMRAIEADAGVPMREVVASPEQVKAAVEAPIDKLTLNERLAKNRSAIVSTIRQELTLGMIQGESYRTMMERIKPTLESDTTKAWRVIRTEGHRVQEGGKMDAVAAADKQGVRMMKTWKTVHDQRVRRRPIDVADHKMLDGKTIPQDQDFEGVKGKGPGPGHLGHPAEDINCRCYLTYSISRVERVGPAPIIPKADTGKPKAHTLEMPDGSNRKAEAVDYNGVNIITPSDLDKKKQRLTTEDVKTFIDQIPEEHRGVLKEVQIMDAYDQDGTKIFKKAVGGFDLRTKAVQIYRNDWLSKDQAKDVLAGTIRHEAAHALEETLPASFLKEWKKAMKADAGHITDYARTDIHEDFAETVMFHWSPDRMERRTVEMFFPERYKILQKYAIKGGGENAG